MELDCDWFGTIKSSQFVVGISKRLHFIFSKIVGVKATRS